MSFSGATRTLRSQSNNTNTARRRADTNFCSTINAHWKDRAWFVWLSCRTNVLWLSLSLADAALQMFTAQMDVTLRRKTLTNDGRRRFFRLRQATQRLKKRFAKQWGCGGNKWGAAYKAVSRVFCSVEIYGRLIVQKSTNKEKPGWRHWWHGSGGDSSHQQMFVSLYCGAWSKKKVSVALLHV